MAFVCHLLQFIDSPEEGEIRGPKKPKIPRGSPPPEEEWAPCIRMLVSESKSLSKGTLFLVTQDGASVGRYVQVPISLITTVRYLQYPYCTSMA